MKALSLWLLSVLICVLAVFVTVSAYAQDKAAAPAAAATDTKAAAPVQCWYC